MEAAMEAAHWKHCHLLLLLSHQMLFLCVQKQNNLANQLRKRFCEFLQRDVVLEAKGKRQLCLQIILKLWSQMLRAISSIIVYVYFYHITLLLLRAFLLLQFMLLYLGFRESVEFLNLITLKLNCFVIFQTGCFDL